MQAEWIETTVGEFSPFLYGRGLEETLRNTQGDVPVYGSNGTIGTHDTSLVSGPVIIVGRKGTVGSVYYSEHDAWPIDTTFYVLKNPQHDIRFTYYLLKALGLEDMNSDSAVPGLNRTAAHSIKIFVPEKLAEQQAIASILSAFDDKIELNRQMNAKLEEIARMLFHSWFVRFDPVRAKSEGREPPGLAPEVAALFPSSFEESELGLVPEGWRVSTIGNEVRVVGGSTPSTIQPVYWEGGTIHWATPKDLSVLSSAVLLNTERRITERGLGQISSGLLPQGTVLMSSRAPIGYLAMAEVPTAINQGFIAMVCDLELTNHYVLQWARANMANIVSHGNGTTFLEVSKANFRPIKVLVPTKDVLKEFTFQVQATHNLLVQLGAIQPMV